MKKERKMWLTFSSVPPQDTIEKDGKPAFQLSWWGDELIDPDDLKNIPNLVYKREQPPASLSVS